MITEPPDAFVELVDRVADRMLGTVGSTDEELADAVAELSTVYTRQRDTLEAASTRRAALAARVRFFLPRDLPKVAGALDELRWAGALPAHRPWRVLDVGAGVGAMTFGIAAFARREGLAGPNVVALDRDERSLRVLEALAAQASQGGLASLELRTEIADLDADSSGSVPPGPFDVVVVGFVLNELGSDASARSELLARLSERLAEDGALIVIEPALKDTSRALQEVRDRIVSAGAPPNVFAPCLRGEDCPMLRNSRDWCHEYAPWALPERLAEVARQAGLRRRGLTWSYLTLRRDGRTLRDTFGTTQGEPYRIVSAPLPSKGKLEMLGCGAPGLPRLMRLDRHESDVNAPLDDVRRGSLVEVATGADAERVRIRSDVRVVLRRP